MRTLFLVSHTHWDREWYEPFQVFRLRLVKCIDKLLDIFATDADYKYFMLDGQTIVLEDYLEVRPEREQTLRDLISSGKLTVGPWYVLPDEFLVSGEAIIRNLMRGIRIANRFGGAMRLGYIPDPFGHISQMPQILRGFGFGAAVFRRGLADEATELWWQGADGTRILVTYLRDSYDNAAWLSLDRAGFVQDIKELRDSLVPHAVTENILLMNGTDHMLPRDDLTALMRTAQKEIADAKLIHASLPMYVERVQAEIAERKIDLRVVSGELRNPKRHHLLPGVLSMRMWIKQRNAHAQTLLEKWAEPFLAFAALEVRRWRLEVGTASTTSNVRFPISNFQLPTSNFQLLALAWKHLLQNHPHDSICGCSVDDTHADMMARFNWVEQIANPIITECLEAIAEQIDTQAMAGSVPLVVFNPVAGPRTDIVTAFVEADFARSVLLDDGGNPVPFAIVDEKRIEFVARDVPGHGYRTFQVKSSKLKEPNNGLTAEHFIENEYLIVEPNHEDGTLTIRDKRTGATFEGVNRFVDGGDRGDLYTYCPPENNSLIRTPSAPPQIEIEKNLVRQTLRIQMNYRLPVSLSNDRKSRSSEMVDENIETIVSIYPNVQRIDFHTTVENRARDHRMRDEFPSPIVTRYANAVQAFDVVQRSLDLPSDTSDWIEQPRPEAPMQSFVSISDGKIGLTLATRGLPEYEAVIHNDQVGTTLALTLLRCVDWLSRDDLATRKGHAGPALETPGAQEIGKHTFEYALIPHEGDWQNAFAIANDFSAPMRSLVTSVQPGVLPSHMSFVETAPSAFVVSAIKLSEESDGLIVRGYNIGNVAIDARIVAWKKFARALRVNLNEDEIAPIDLREGREVQVNVRAKEIVTIKFTG